MNKRLQRTAASRTTRILALGMFLSTFSMVCGAQGIRLIEACPDADAPAQQASPQLPSYSGQGDYDVVATFIIDVNGSVVAPRVKESIFTRSDSAAIDVPAGFDTAFLAALAKWKYPRRSRPCSAVVKQRISLVI